MLGHGQTWKDASWHGKCLQPLHSQSSWLSEVTRGTHLPQPFFSLAFPSQQIKSEGDLNPCVRYWARSSAFLTCGPEVTFELTPPKALLALLS